MYRNSKRLSWANQCFKSKQTAFSGDLFLPFFPKASTQRLISSPTRQPYTEIPKDFLDLTNALNLNKLLFQEIYPFHSSQKLPLSESFQVQNEIYLDQTSKDEFKKCQFIISSSQTIIPQSEDTSILAWAGIRTLLSNTLVPRMHVGFLPYLASPVSEYYTVFRAMKNFTQRGGQLKQDAFPLFWG